jgi:signal transduction histidine kinase
MQNLVLNARLDEESKSKQQVEEKNVQLEREVAVRKRVEKELQKAHDVLEIRVKERTRELEETQKELINKAMEAGRAQLSAMVLHNIGNAITPIKIQIEGMKSDELGQTSQYLEKCYLDISDHIGDLQNYVNDDPRGKNVFNYMGELINSLNGQRKQKEGVIKKMDEAVSYISEILTLQQAYAANEQETKERTDLNALIENAIRMQIGSLEKREITVRTDLNPKLPRLLIDKNRLMQVIVNFIKNSYEAIDDLNGNNREKWISFKSFSENGRLGFKITDSGIGIEPAHIDTIFEFGESHKGSSGFGLYYCKMFVEGNKGILNFSSQGKGKGATVEVMFESNET